LMPGGRLQRSPWREFADFAFP